MVKRRLKDWRTDTLYKSIILYWNHININFTNEFVIIRNTKEKAADIFDEYTLIDSKLMTW